MYKVPREGYTLIRKGPLGRTVSFNKGLLKIPFHIIEEVKTSISTIDIDISEPDNFKSKDGKLVTLNMKFDVAVNRLEEAVVTATQMYGIEKLNCINKLTDYLSPKFKESAKSAIVNVDYENLKKDDQIYELKGVIVNLIGTDMNGLILEDLNIEIK